MSGTGVRGRARARWLLAEVLVVILGVLIALWVDGLRQASSDEASEQFLLRNLLSEAVEDRRQFDFTLGLYDRRYQAQEQLVLLGTGAATLTPDSLDALWSLAVFPGVTAFDDAALTSALSSGGLNLIQDDTLRVLIGEWPSSRHAFSGWEAEYNRTLAQSLMPLLRGRYSLPSAIGPGPMAGDPDTRALSRAAADPEVLQSLRQLSSFWYYFDEIFGAGRREFLERLENRIKGNLNP